MSISPSDSAIFGPNFNHPAIAGIFSDQRYVHHMLAVEAALARVLGRAEVIPEAAARRIEASARALDVNLEQLRCSTQRAGFPVVELVRQLRDRVGEQAAPYVHWGSTTQDIMDTARVLQVREALDVLESELATVIEGLVQLTEAHRWQVMAGRTHALQALPITFGYKVASWLMPLVRHGQRLQELRPRALALQFGAAAGTLAPYGASGPELYLALAAELDLGAPPMPWHTQRDVLVELGDWLSRLTGSLGKMAQDVILLSQTEIAEVLEAGDQASGSSSTLPHKRNPIHSEAILVAARANAAAVSALHGAMVHEHERGTHGLQLEWVYLPQMFALSGVALKKAALISRDLVVDAERMQANIENAQYLILAEPLKFALSALMDMQAAEQLVRQASHTSIRERRHLVEVVREQVGAELDWARIADPAAYLGASQWFIDRTLGEAAAALNALRQPPSRGGG